MRSAKIFRPLRAVAALALLLGFVAIEAASATLEARMQLDPATASDPAGQSFPGPMAKKFHHATRGA
jgi:hypothetical protein